MTFDILAAQFEDHFSGQNSITLNACNIANFYPKRLKLRNGVFQRWKFITALKEFLVHMHFKEHLNGAGKFIGSISTGDSDFFLCPLSITIF